MWKNKMKENSVPEAIILDRDGTLIVDKEFVHKISDVEFLPRTIAGLKQVAKETKLIIITNQAGIGRGLYKEEDYKKCRDYIHEQLKKEGVIIVAEYFCPHHPTKGIIPYNIDCTCRKPETALFEQAVKDFALNPEKCWCIGDMRRDIIPGQKLGMKGILVKTGFGGQGGEGDPVTPEYVAEDLYDAIEYIRKQEEKV